MLPSHQRPGRGFNSRVCSEVSTCEREPGQSEVWYGFRKIIFGSLTENIGGIVGLSRKKDHVLVERRDEQAKRHNGKRVML